MPASWRMRKNRQGTYFFVVVNPQTGVVSRTGDPCSTLQQAIDDALEQGCPADQLPLQYEGDAPLTGVPAGRSARLSRTA